MSIEIGTWVHARASEYIHGEIIGVVVGIPTHAPDTMVTVRYHTTDYRGWPTVADRWVFIRDLV